jgi:putative sterol carrier protein
MAESVLFSQEWCESAKKLWDVAVVPVLVDPDTYDYVVEFRATDLGAVCQLKAAKGKVLEWNAGKKYSDDEADFLIDATKDNWQKVGNGKLDPVGAVASKRIHLRKGPMPVVIKEAQAFTQLLGGFGTIPTAW